MLDPKETTPEELLPGLYRIEVPLPNSPLRALNSYVIKGRDRSLVIDTGMNREECLRSMLSDLSRLGIDLERTDFFITHLHADHLGLVGPLARAGSVVYFNQSDADISNFLERSNERWEQQHAFFLAHGFPEDELNEAWKSHPGKRFGPRRLIDFKVVKDGDTVTAGDYEFTCVETKGHSPGHMCLYERRRKVLVCGDCILLDITPNINFWPELDNSLKAYLVSLEKINLLDVELVLPGHGRVWRDLQGRVSDLRKHHRDRLVEVLEAVRQEHGTAYDIAPRITWNIEYKSWKLFPATQKWFAVGETVAHLKYLENEGSVTSSDDCGKVIWRFSGNLENA